MASLTPEQKDLLQLEIQTLDDSWLARLKDEVTSPEFLSLKRFLLKEKQSGATIFPPEDEIYSWYFALLFPLFFFFFFLPLLHIWNSVQADTTGKVTLYPLT